MDRGDRDEFLKHVDEAVKRVYACVKKWQNRYKRDLDTRFHRANLDFEAGYYVFLDSILQQKRFGKFTSPAVSPYRVITRYQRTFTIDRAGVTERVKRVRVNRFRARVTLSLIL